MKHTKDSEESMPWFIFRLCWSSFVGIFFVIPSFIVLYILNDLLRFVVNLRLWWKYGEKTHVIEEGVDAVWLYKVQNGKRQILYLAINDEPMDLETHRKNYVEKVLNKPAYQKFKQIWTVEYSYNVLKYDKDFDIRKHIYHYPGSEDKVITEKELMDHILPALSEEMDETKPQWEDVILPHFKYNESDDKVRSCRIFRVSHAYMDGGSNLLFIADTQFEGEGKFPYVIDPASPLKIPLWKRVVHKIMCLLMFGWVVLHGIFFPARKMVRNRFRTPVLSGSGVYTWSKPIEMDVVQAIRQKTSKSMSTILLTALGEGIHKLNRKYPTKNPEFIGTDPEDLTVGMVGGIFPYPDIKLKNRHSIFHVKIDVSDKSPLDRLESMNETMDRCMWDPHTYLNYVIPNLFGRTPIWFSDACMRVMGFPLVLSNIPVARERVNLWGNNVRDIGGWPPMLSLCGVGLVTIRYGDYLRVCANSDSASISKEELHFLISEITDAMYKLAEEAVVSQEEVEETLLESLPDCSPTAVPTTHKSFEETFFHNFDGNKGSIRFRLNNSLNAIKDSLSKFREP